MKTVLREDDSGVSEVVGTILILAMTVVLFSSIILWVGSIPTPTTQTRVDLRPSLTPLYDGGGNEIGINITLLHRGVEALGPAPTVIYVTSQRGTNPPSTDTVILHKYNPFLGTPSGILDGPDIVWDIGERWAYENFLIRSSDQIRVTVVDIFKNQVLWTAAVTAPAGTRPPVFVAKWSDDMSGTATIDSVQANLGFILYARVIDPDIDLNRNSVYATLTMFFGTLDPCEQPQKMHDDGIYPDIGAEDDVFSLGGISCMVAPFPFLNWDGAIILINATDLRGHETKTRFVLKVVEQTTSGGIQTIPSQLWQYIGFVQIRAGDVWVTNMSDPVNTAKRYAPYRVTKAQLAANGGPLFHLRMENHGNRTIFIDGWTSMVFSSSARASVSGGYVLKPVDVTKQANAGGLGAYPGSAANANNFQYAQVFDVNPTNQEVGGLPTTILVASKTAFTTNWPLSFPQAELLFINILISGMAGPENMTYQQILSQWGPSYNPIDHLNDVNPATRTQWYAQVIPFVGMVVYP